MLNWNNTKVTLELNDLIESGCDPWAFDYPSYYKDAEKTAFEQKVIDHYRFRQIGQETPGRWLHYFRTRIREIMPYYIQLYESQALMQAIEDPFGNVDVTETFEQTSTGERSGTLSRSTSDNLDSTTTGTLDSETTGSLDSETTGSLARETTGSSESETTEDGETNVTGTKRFSNTPQGSIANLDNYLTEATKDSNDTLVDNTVNVNTTTGGTQTDTTGGTQKDTTSGTQKDTASGTQKDTRTGSQEDTTQDTETGTIRHTLTRRGNQGVNTYAHDMKELRETFLNIDMMIINELKDLFLLVY